MADRDGSARGMQFLATAAWFTGMGWAIAVSIALGVFIGYWVDGKTGTHPVFLLLGLGLGLAVGLLSAGRMLMRFLSEPDTQ